MNIKSKIQKWTEENKPIGKAFGYPECCIDAFCNQPPALMNGKSSKDDYIRYKAGFIEGKFTGFIPCITHAKLIKGKKITLQSLLSERRSDLPEFPNAQQYMI